MTILQNSVDEFTIFITNIQAFIVEKAIPLLFIIFMWFFLGFALRKTKKNLSPELYNALKTLGRASLILFGLLLLVGEELFIGAAALLGTAIGFASSTTIGNFISGLYLLITNPFNVGDYIILTAMKIEGIVEEVSINYTKILTPQGIHVSITNQKLLNTPIHNTSITVPVEAVVKGKITWRDNEGDKFDSIEDVVDIFKGIRTKYSDKEKEFFLYPLNFKINPDKYLHQKTREVFNEAVKEFSKRTAEKISWFMLDRSNYQLNLIVENPYSIFDLKNEILGFVEERIEEQHRVK